MLWLRSHPFALLFAGAGLVLLAIVIIINGKTVPPSSFGRSVALIPGGSSNTLQDPGISERYISPADAGDSLIEPSVQTTQSDSGESGTASIPIPAGSPQTSPSRTTPEETETQFFSPLFSGTAPSSASSPDTSLADKLLSEAYALVPPSYSLAINAPTTRSPEQQALYRYGNQAGLAVITFSNTHADMADVLTTWTEDRDDDAARAQAEEIAVDMIALGDTLLSLQNVPQSAAAANQALAAGYKTAGAELSILLDSGGSDSRLLDSMNEYNAAADEFARSYIALVDLFARSDVTFAPTDMGSAFALSAPSL